MLGLSGSPSDGGTTHIQPPRAGNAASAAASTITVKYKDQSTKEPIPDYPDGNLVTSATATSQTVESTLDLSGQPDFFPDGPFTPDVTVNADEQGPQQPTPPPPLSPEQQCALVAWRTWTPCNWLGLQVPVGTPGSVG